MTNLLAELRFATAWPVWSVGVLAIGLATVVMVVYFRQSRSLPQPWSWLLPGLRGTAVGLAVLLVAGPVWHRRQIVGTPGRVVLAVDTSASMAQTDSQSGSTESASRLDRAAELLSGSASSPGWIETLRDSHWIDVVSFDGQSRLLWTSVEGDATAAPVLPTVAAGQATRLDQPLASLLTPPDSQNEKGQAGSIVVLLSDGRETAAPASDPKRSTSGIDIASELKRRGWRVDALALGTEEEPADIAVKRVDAPERIADEGRLAGRIDLKAFGVAGREVKIEIDSGGRVVWSKNRLIDSDGDVAVEFDFPVADLVAATTASGGRGIDRDSVVLPLRASVSMMGEPLTLSGVSDENDSLGFRVAAAARDRRLLILDGSSRWETRYLRNLFARDPGWEVDTLLFGPGTDQLRVVRGDAPGQLPDSSRAWSRYDAVILGEVPVDQWTAEDSEGLRSFVRRGGGLIVIDGRYLQIERLAASWQAGVSLRAGVSIDEQSPSAPVMRKWLSDLIPVTFEKTLETDDASESATLQSQVQRPVTVSLSPTTVGGEHPALRLRPDAEESLALWRQLPPPQTIPVVTAAVDAEVWADAELADGQRTPWLVTRMVGGGRVFYLATDQTWRWRFKVESQLHGRFWNQLLAAAMQPPYAASDDFVAIGTDRVDYSVGDAITIRARLLVDELAASVAATAAENGEASLPTVDAVIVRDDEIVATVPLSVDDPDRQTFIGQSMQLPPGRYEVRVRASGYDSAALRASTPIWVDAPRMGEGDRVAADPAQLRSITDAGGGMTVHESSAADLLQTLVASSRGQILETDTLMYQSWLAMAAVILILAIEWWLRKKVGLL